MNVKVVIWVAVAMIGIAGYGLLKPASVTETIAPLTAAERERAARATVVMYSLVNCPYCVVKRGELTRLGIPFREYFLDQEPARLDEFNGKIQALGIPVGRVGTPTFDVNGVLLINNPSISEIRRHL